MENFNTRDSEGSPEQRVTDATLELELAQKELGNEQVGGGRAHNEEGNPYTKLGGINLPEVAVLLHKDLMSTIDLAIQDDKDIANLAIVDSEKAALADACLQALHEVGRGRGYGNALEAGEFEDGGRMAHRYSNLYQENYNNGSFRAFLKEVIQRGLAAVRGQHEDTYMPKKPEKIKFTTLEEIKQYYAAFDPDTFMQEIKEDGGHLWSMSHQLTFTVYKLASDATGSHENYYRALKRLYSECDTVRQMEISLVIRANKEGVIGGYEAGNLIGGLLKK